MFKIRVEGVTIAADVNTAAESADYSYEGDRAAEVRLSLEGAYGCFGHLFDPTYGTACDLWHAARSRYDDAKMIEGADLVTPTADIPAGAVS